MIRFMMKPIVCFICLFGGLINTHILYAQEACRESIICPGGMCCPGGICRGNITVNYQSSPAAGTTECEDIIDAYPTGITRIEGNLLIGQVRGQLLGSPITDLSRFSQLQEVTGNLTVSTAFSGAANPLQNLSALRSLTTIGGNFVLGEGPDNSVGLDFFTSVGELPALTTIGRSFTVSGNQRMETLGEFPFLRSIGGSFTVENNHNRSFNRDGLTSLGRFSSLGSIGADFKIDDQRALRELHFPTLRSIGGAFQVRAIGLTSLDKFPALSSIGGGFFIGDAGTSGVGNNDLISLGPFPRLGFIGGNFLVRVNPALTSLGDFSALSSIGGSFRVVSNGQLRSLGDFSGLERIGDVFNADSNSQLNDCCGVPVPVLAAIVSRQGASAVRFSENNNNRCRDREQVLRICRMMGLRLNNRSPRILNLAASAGDPNNPDRLLRESIFVDTVPGTLVTATIRGAPWIPRLGNARPAPDGTITDSRPANAFGSYQTRVSVQPNTDTRGRSTMMIISADGVDDLIIPIHQRGTADQRPTFGGTTVAAQSYTQGEVVMLTLPEASDGNAPLGYSLRPGLPAGLSFNRASRRISGVPTEAPGTTTYTYRVTDSDNDQDMLTFDLTVTGVTRPTFIGRTVADRFYSERSEFIDTLFLPSAVGGTAPLIYTLRPEQLPEGLAFIEDQQIITSISDPIGVIPRTEYTYTVRDAGGVETSLNFDITVLALSLALNADSRVDQRDAQALYYAYLPGLNETTQEALFGRLGVAGGDAVAELRARAGFWRDLALHDESDPDLNQDGRIDQRDARILYYTYRFGDLLGSSEGLRNALLGGLSSDSIEASAVLDRANALINSQR